MLELFDPLVAGWFRERLGEPTAAQRDGWPAIAAGRDTLIAAPTGSGKTLAAFLFCLDGLVRRARAGGLEDRTLALYVSPLKALSEDVRVNLTGPLDELRARAEAEGTPLGEIRVAVRTGDTPARERDLHARRPPHVLVTTPESLYLLLTTVRGRRALAGVETVIVDEIHAVAGDRRGAHLSLSLERLDALVQSSGRSRPQRIGLSATQRPIERVAEFLTGGGPCAIVDRGHARALDLGVGAPAGELSAVASHEQWADVYDQIVRLAALHRTTIVFANTRRLVERVAHALTERLGESQVGAHHGAMSRRMRHDVERKLKSGALRVCVATASLELGIDVGAVDLVVQLGSPRAISTFLQRVGRSGHGVRATPKGRIFALTRDDLLEAAALLRAVRAGRLDALVLPDKPLDVLAQQMVAACVTHEWSEDELFALVRRARPYRHLSRREFDAVVEMLSEGFAPGRGRSTALLHRDRVAGRLRARRKARLLALLSGGAIPERADFEVVAEPEGTRVGTLDEDFAIESMAGDVFLLGNTSWRIRRVEAGRVLVEDARGQAPTIPFWLGEGPSRTRELSEEVSRLREELEPRLGDPAGAARWLAECAGLGEDLARQAVDYAAATRAALGALPTQRTLIAERFFDESGGMQLVLHAPFGARLNRAFGLALRKSFCRTWDFELQAAATDDGILLSLGPQHSFPLETIFEYVRRERAREVLVQAALQAPVFGVRWRWVATRALAVPRWQNGRKVPPALQRMRAEDLLAAVFPAKTACQDNRGGGDLKPPDHPLVNQALADCLEEWMDTEGLCELLRRLEAGELRVLARDTPEPSPMSHSILNANPYAFLDDAPLEERRARAVSVRRGLPADVARELGALDAEAIAQVRRDAWPRPRDAHELADALCLLGALPERDAKADLAAWMDELVAARRATRARLPGGLVLWVAAERLELCRAAYGPAELELLPPIPPAPGAPAPDRDDAIVALVRGRLESTGPTTEADLAAALALAESEVAAACARLELEGAVLRGRFTPGANRTEWCDRRLLARIHRLTLGRLRREIEPVTTADLARFLLRWQHVAPGTQLHGLHGLRVVLDQLAGAEAPVAAWERDILPARVADYSPALIDELCLAGEIVWGRRSASEASVTTRATPIALWSREATPFFVSRGDDPLPSEPDAPTREVVELLATRGALFYAEILAATGLTRRDLDEALWTLVARGRVTADGFGALRTLAQDSPRRTGRWSLLRADAPPPPEEVAIRAARQLLLRYGVVYRELVAKEITPPWREILVQLRRLEAKGELRGGRFVSGVVGEQFALPEAVDGLRAVRRMAPEGDPGELMRFAADALLGRLPLPGLPPVGSADVAACPGVAPAVTERYATRS